MKYLPIERPEGAHVGYQQQVKEANIKRIFDLVRDGRCRSRAEIVRNMNLSATSVSVLVEELTHRRFIDEKGPAQTSQPGRRPISLQLNREAHQIAAFLLSPAGVEFALVNTECRILERCTVPLPSASLNAQTAGEAYGKLFDEILRKRSKRFAPSKALVVTITFPGVYVQRDRLFLTEPALGFSLQEEDLLAFQRKVGLPIFLFNEARSMAYAEKKYLDRLDISAPAVEDLLFVKVNSGISCAIISDGNMYTGPYNVSGEIGHFTIDYQGLPCPCGNRGCLERYVNANRILQDARQAAEQAGIPAPEDLEELARRCPDEPALMQSLRRSAELLSFGLYSIMCSSGMRRIALGGGVEALGDVFLREIYRNLMGRSMLIRRLDLSYAQAGQDAKLLGAAEYYLDKVLTITL